MTLTTEAHSFCRQHIGGLAGVRIMAGGTAAGYHRVDIGHLFQRLLILMTKVAKVVTCGIQLKFMVAGMNVVTIGTVPVSNGLMVELFCNHVVMALITEVRTCRGQQRCLFSHVRVVTIGAGTSTNRTMSEGFASGFTFMAEGTEIAASRP